LFIPRLKKILQIAILSINRAFFVLVEMNRAGKTCPPMNSPNAHKLHNPKQNPKWGAQG
jgi:hypothetical protein